jgi:PAS domain S-box-containing protein
MTKGNNEIRPHGELEVWRTRYFELYNLAPVGYLTLSEPGLIVDVNPAAAGLLGMTGDDLVRQSLSRFIFIEDQDSYYRLRQQLFETGMPQSCEIRMLRADNSLFWVRLDASAARNADKVSICRVVISNITIYKRAEAALRDSNVELAKSVEALRVVAESGVASGEEIFRFLVRQIAVSQDKRYALIARIDAGDLATAHTVAVWSNGEFAENFNYTLEGTPCSNVAEQGACFYPRDIQKLFPRDRLLVDMGAESYWGTPLRDTTGNVIGVMAILDDRPMEENSRILSLLNSFAARAAGEMERRRTEEEKAKLEAHLQQAQKMELIGSLAGGIAHDLNNILSPISGLSEMLLEDIPPGSPAHESMEQIHNSAQRGSDLVKQILAFCCQSKHQKLPIRIQPILKEVLKLARATISMNIEITSHIKPDCGMVSADPTQIHQTAMNLITNAFHAVEQKGGTINITLKETAIGSLDEKEELPFHAIPEDLLAGKYACITVSDTGTGMDQTLIDKIFDPYFTTKGQGKGMGLELSVVHGIVKEHGGDIRVYSELGKGTAFYVYLPLLEDANDSKAAAVVRKYPTGHENILLVDDEAPIVRMEQMMLERLGYRVTVRTSSPDALAAFRADPSLFNLVISDRGMPNMTGEQLAAELISIRPGIPIILCTGFSDETDVQRAKAMGVKGFLMKPVATGDLAEMVRKVLDEVAGSVLANEFGQADIIIPMERQLRAQGNG